ncbi:hypothetical protein Salat_1637400 [Sesamum alatum]|uniref:Uncharacterized protein n=1 Tax=Sesamum alatum TaxID=300844 RepID=A0AAE1Y6G5_9LAMI|nr:hypothetical protein Salat_1637400 [Sesamum alatum]
MLVGKGLASAYEVAIPRLKSSKQFCFSILAFALGESNQSLNLLALSEESFTRWRFFLCPCWRRACVDSLLWVMPLTRFVADALDVVTICLVAVFVLLGLFCIVHLFYFRNEIRSQGLVQLSFFNGPWIIRITYIFFAVWWSIGEIIRLNLLRRKGRILNALNLKWQENVCKCYIVSNLGFAEPCLFLTLIFLLRASLQRSGTLNQNWNSRTAGFVLLFCFPMVILQLVIILIAPRYKDKRILKLPSYFINAATSSNTKDDDVALCTYPLLSTIFLGLFATVLTAYMFWLGRRILHLVINKGLQKRVYTLIFSISGFLPLRVLLLGLSVLSRPEKVVFDAIVFLAFLSLLCCACVGICMLVYLPIADSLALRNLHKDTEATTGDECNDSASLIANQSPVEGSPARNSSASTNRGSISFRTKEKDNTSGAGFVELSLFTPSQHSSPPGSPRLLGWPMISPSPAQGQEP